MIIVSRIDDTQADFQEGVLTDVEADAGGFLRLADVPVLDFDGVDDKVPINWLSGDIINTFTMETWVYPRRTIDIFSQSNSGIPNGTSYAKNLMICESHGGDLKAGAGLSIGTNGIAVIEHGSSYYPQVLSHSTSFSGWTHIAIIYNNRIPSLYINGQFIKTGLTSGRSTVYPGICPNYWGELEGLGFGQYGYFNGLITEVRIWNVARTQAEIQADMNKRLTGNEIGLVAYYPLDEGTGTIATDNVGANNGTIYGATWVQNELLYFMNPDKNNNRVSPQIDLSKAVTVKGTSISWTETLNGQTINIETRVSFDGGLTWTPWSTCVNGGSIPNLTPSTQVVNALLECRQNLSTTDPAYSPQLETLNITVEGIGMTLFQSFNF